MFLLKILKKLYIKDKDNLNKDKKQFSNCACIYSVKKAIQTKLTQCEPFQENIGDSSRRSLNNILSS